MTAPTGPKPADPLALLRTRRYLALLVFAAILGVPIAAIAYGFLKLVDVIQNAVFTKLPSGLGFHGEPLWWPLLPLAVAGLLVALTIRYLPGKGGHSPADGFHTGGTVNPADIPGVFLAALTTLSLGAVLGPEAPLIALGAGLAVLAVRFSRREQPAQTLAVVGAAGSFAAIATLFGSPLPAAFLLMEVVGLGGAMLDLVLLPGLLAAGVGALIFVGLDAWTGFGTFSLAVPNLPAYSHPDLAQFGWALLMAPAAAVLGAVIRRIALAIRPHVERRMLLLTPLVGLAVAGLAIAYAAAHREGLFRGPVLRAVGARPVHQPGRNLLRRGAADAARVQGARLRGVTEQLPRRSDIPRDVHRRGGRSRGVAPARTPAGAGRGHRYRRDGRGDAQAAPHLGAAGDPAAGVGRAGRDTAGDRGGGGGLCRIGPAHAPRRPGSGGRIRAAPARETSPAHGAVPPA